MARNPPPRQLSRRSPTRAVRENLWSAGNPTAQTLFPILGGESVTNVAIESLTLDGNKTNNAELDGNYAGCIFLQDCADVTVRKVIARDYRGDGISWQICHDVLVEQCESRNHTGLGLHPGSGSQRPVIRGNTVVGCHIGLFFCWGVKYGLAEKNTIEDTKTAGISVGHRDTNNLIRNNTVRRSGQAGILFRPERGQGFTGDRNTVEGNTVIDTGGEDAAAVDRTCLARPTARRAEAPVPDASDLESCGANSPRRDALPSDGSLGLCGHKRMTTVRHRVSDKFLDGEDTPAHTRPNPVNDRMSSPVPAH